MFWSLCVLITKKKRVSGPCKVSELFSEHLLSPCPGPSLIPGTITLLLISSEVQLTDGQLVLLNQISVAFPYLICLFLVFIGASSLKTQKNSSRLCVGWPQVVFVVGSFWPLLQQPYFRYASS